jgi:hypothetical protein
VLDQFEADADSSSQFSLPVALTPTSSWQLIGTRKVASGGQATMQWSGRAPFGEYEWYVNVSDGHTDLDGPAWSFTTGSAAPNVALTRPNGGESFMSGASEHIEWNASDDVGVTSVDILVSRDGVNGTYETIATGLSNTGSYDWTVPGTGSANAFIKVVAHDAEDNDAFDVSDLAFEIVTPTGVNGSVPSAYGLGMLSENPFSQSGTFGVSLKHATHVSVIVYDVAGRRVAQLLDESMPAGRHTVRWNGETLQGRAASGVYFVRMEAAGLRFTKRVVLIR